MKLTTILSALSISILFGCGRADEKATRTSPDIDSVVAVAQDTVFDQYLKAIPLIELPLDLKCASELEGSTLDLDTATIAKYGQAFSRINGTIAVRDNFTAIIYLYPADIVLPIIQTTDRQGRKISELNMYDKWCGEDAFSWGTSWATITKDLAITLSDSAITYKRNDKGHIVDESKTTVVRHRKFQIDINGRIEEVK